MHDAFRKSARLHDLPGMSALRSGRVSEIALGLADLTWLTFAG
jgi:hypothetical protein